jgi:hypothetical protein
MMQGPGFRLTSNLIVTGIPRAGTTLTAALIDGMEDAVCLNEPKWQSTWSREETDRAAYVKRIVEDFARVRSILLAGGSVEIRASSDGVAVTNFFDQSAGGRKRKPLTFAPMSRAGLSPGFLLAMKHNAHYSCVLEELAATPGFCVLAIVRNPVATLLSWRSLDVPISKGRLPIAEPFWPEVAAAGRSTPDILLAQVRILELLFQRYTALSEKIAIIRLEDMIAKPDLLNTALGRKQRRPVTIEASRLSSSTPLKELKLLQDYVTAHCPTARHYYPVSENGSNTSPAAP